MSVPDTPDHGRSQPGPAGIPLKFSSDEASHVPPEFH